MTHLAKPGVTRNSEIQASETRNAIIRTLAERPGASIRELCVIVGKRSTSTVQHHLWKLEAQGKIVRDSCPLCRAPIWRRQ